MGAKLFFLLLVLIAVAFFFTMAVGAGHNNSQDPPPASGSSAQQDYVMKNPPPPWIGNMIGFLSPKLSLPQKEFRFGAVPIMVDVPAGSTRYRNATIRVTTGCTPVDCSVNIAYQSKNDEGKDMNLDQQTWTPSSKDKPDQASLVIMESGGTLTFSCTSAPQCIAVLQ